MALVGATSGRTAWSGSVQGILVPLPSNRLGRGVRNLLAAHVSGMEVTKEVYS